MDKCSKYRVVIVDVTHLFYKFAFGCNTNLTSTIKIGGVPKIVNTTLPTMTIKAIHRWARGGSNPVVVCFDGEGCTRSRKAYFRTGTAGGGQQVGYKESRSFQDDTFYMGINMTLSALKDGGVMALRLDGFEADDIVAAAVAKAKVQYPDMPIDVITGDQDLLPLVDDQVSVFLTSKKTTYAIDKQFEKRGYVQITPENYQAYIEGLTEFKNLYLPYNTVLLKKLLRGKKADDVPGYPKFTPTKFNKLVQEMQSDGYDLHDLFVYDAPTATPMSKSTWKELTPEELKTWPKDDIKYSFGDPPALTRMCEVLSQYLDEDIINHIRFIYNGINLNCAYRDVPDRFKRSPLAINKPLSGYSFNQLQSSVGLFQINLPEV